jgi:formate dehydrogenase major subunit
VQGYISLIEKRQYHEAVALIKDTNPFPAVCGRVCVRPCEVACRRNLLDEGAPVGIDYLKRFTSDIDIESPDKWKPEIKPSTGKKVAVIGAGPGGMSCGFFLQKEGHQVDVFEANKKAGGWLRYGIPEYRLPNNLLQKEIDNITEMGVKIKFNKQLGKNLKYEKLKKDYDAVILTIGSQKGTLVGTEGEDAEGVWSGIDFLKEMEETGKKYNFKGKKVAVIGGGNTAMDCCRTSIRCGADQVYVIYRRTENEMPANPIEIHESKLEGVEYRFLTNPSRINKTKDGKVKSVTCLKMELGQPDASGRRRPVPIPESDFDIEVDYVLAAIGQKTVADFVDEVNTSLKNGGELKTNRWGDIDADPATLQTGVENIFAAGDGVTGPATLIEAIGQAKLASRSCHQYLSGEPVTPPQPEFISRKDNYKTQEVEDYKGHFKEQKREEMPTIPPDKRNNFKEVELGYDSEEVALHETDRCLECGCTELFTCDLKKHATDYQAEQGKYPGEFKEYHVDFRHPLIEIDNNKCILCARCVRICREVAGADALGLINRGFNTYVAPSMGKSLQDTPCETCGLCIDTCPTGAIIENVPFKPGPVVTEPVETICNYCSVGCKISLEHKNQFVMRVNGADGAVNKDGNICKYPKFGYHYLNDTNRITKPLLKINGRFEEVSFEKAYEVIRERIDAVKPEENAFFAGARLTNEEMYLLQKLARKGAKTNNITSFHYLNRGIGYKNNVNDNVPLEQLNGASRVYLFGSEINEEHAIAGFMIQNNQVMRHIPVTLVTEREKSSMEHKVNDTIRIKSYYYFIKAVNYYLVANNFYNQMYLDGNCEGFEEYKEALLKENFVELIEKAGAPYMDLVVEFAKNYNNEMNAIIVFSENHISSNTSQELFNLAMITGKLGKTSNGLISLKEKNNSQGLFDMGVCMKLGVGGEAIDNTRLISKMKQVWEVNELPSTITESIFDWLEEGKLKNLFIFGEDPLGTTGHKVQLAGWLSIAQFKVVQDYFLTETAKLADLVLPASLPIESGGSFTNTQKVLQEFEPVFDSKVERNGWEQLKDLLEGFGSKEKENVKEVLMEALSLLPAKDDKEKKALIYTGNDNPEKMFRSGCDHIQHRFEQYIENLLG